jgi:hypothetical protein
MNIQQAKHIQQIVGLSHLRIAFKRHIKPFKYNEVECLGLCTTNEFGAVTIDFVDDSEAIHTVLHELSHANGVRDCNECDRIADNLVEFVAEELTGKLAA